MALKPNYKIRDSFMQDLNDFDVVAISDNDGGIACCTLGVYFQTYLFTYDDFYTKTVVNKSKAVPVTYKRNNLFHIGRSAGVADRAGIESGMVTGEFMLKSAIKIDQLTEEMMYFRSDVLEDIKSNRVTTKIPRKVITLILDEARKQNRITN
jgi:hypothetical protein